MSKFNDFFFGEKILTSGTLQTKTVLKNTKKNENENLHPDPSSLIYILIYHLII